MGFPTLSAEKILELSGVYWKSCAIHAAIKLDLFSIVGQGRLTEKEVAEKLNGDQRSVGVLLNALTAMGFLIKSDDRYANTPLSESALSKDSPDYIGYMIMHHYHLMDSWHHLDRAVMTGKPVRFRDEAINEEQRESFLMGMFNVAMAIAPEVTKKIDLSHQEHLLDLGGGPGTWAIYFCLNNSGLKVTVYDLPETRPFAEKTIRRFGLSDRINFQEGNYLEGDLKGRYDVAWLSHILHSEGPEDCQVIIRKAISVLKPGGLIMIHEFILNRDLKGPLYPALFSLNMLVGTKAGRSYSEKEIVDMLTQEGATGVKRLKLPSLKNSGIIIGTVRNTS
mgnify:CR=1 FL=1